MMEDIVLLETQTARKDAQVFHLQFAVDEFDMVVFSPRTASCEVYEIKHSTEMDSGQARHLRDEKKGLSRNLMGKVLISPPRM